MGYLAAYLPLCLAPIAIVAIWRAVDRRVPVPSRLLAGYAWAMLLMGGFGIAAAVSYGGCGAEPEPGVVHCERAGLVCHRDWAPGCPVRERAQCDPPDGRGYCATGWRASFQYCEQMERGRVAQEQSTWSDLAFVASGLFVLMLVELDRRRPDWRGRRRSFMMGPSCFSVPYGFVVIFMGPASMVLHASMKAWAGFMDNFSILIWTMFGLGYSLTRWPALTGNDRSELRHDIGWTIAFWLFFVLGLVFLGIISGSYPGSRDILVGVVAGLWALNELLQWLCLATRRRFETNRQGGAALAIYVLIAALIGFAFLFKEQCASPASTQQGHPLFHTFAAVATLMAFLLFRLKPETRRV